VTLAALVTEIAATVGGVDGVSDAPAVPMDQIPSGGVYAYVWPAAGSLDEVTLGRMRGTHTIHVMVATPLRNWRTDWERVLPYGDSVPDALLKARLGIHENSIRYTFGELEWGGAQMLGWRFELEVLDILALSSG
jgi:hypothetical protein